MVLVYIELWRAAKDLSEKNEFKFLPRLGIEWRFEKSVDVYIGVR
jgi:hypothetical protein